MPTTVLAGAALASRLDALIRMEIASIGAIEAATKHQEEPAYVFLYQETKTGKQASVEQMATLLRMTREQPDEQTGVLAAIAKMQTAMMQRMSTTATLKAMRLVEEQLVAEYRAVFAALEEASVAGRGMKRVMERAVKHWHVLTAHIAKRSGDAGEAERLPFPLGQYFAGPEAKACMRCLFDRPGVHGAIEKTDPHPYTYICAACHDEVLADLPSDLLDQAVAWPEDARRNRVVERALGKPEKLRAQKEPVALLSGLEPDIPTRREKPTEAEAELGEIAPPAERALPVLDLPRDGASESELAYSDLLFDFSSVRRSW
jgi:hypothetical protein